MDMIGIIDAESAGAIAMERVLGVPLVGWAAHGLMRALPRERVVIRAGSPAVRAFADRHGLRVIDADAPLRGAIVADAARPFVLESSVLAAVTARASSLAAHQRSPMEALRITGAEELELARAVALGLPTDHPIVRGVMRWRLPITRHIRAIITDVDGVLTDGGIHFTGSIKGGRVFSTKDGLGHHLLFDRGFKVGWLSATSEAESIMGRARMLGVEHVDAGKGEKGARFTALCARLGVDAASVVYLGDDVNDLPAMALAGLSACPADAHDEVRNRVDLVLESRGGEGCFRELADVVLAGTSVAAP